ncbi:hypothetical protein JTB14_005341 [Gonioctena quinquepunctata]|nr:hypothetical protein JTB14_005341 [Gonioctena quinquepunctata]
MCEGVEISRNKFLVYLGVTLGERCSFAKHIKSAVRKVDKGSGDYTENEAQWTEASITNLENWIDCKHRQVDYFLSQALTEHGCSNAYLERIGKMESDYIDQYCRIVYTEDYNIFEYEKNFSLREIFIRATRLSRRRNNFELFAELRILYRKQSENHNDASSTARHTREEKTQQQQLVNEEDRRKRLLSRPKMTDTEGWA